MSDPLEKKWEAYMAEHCNEDCSAMHYITEILKVEPGEYIYVAACKRCRLDFEEIERQRIEAARDARDDINYKKRRGE